jgi:hypothetical protein
MRYSSVDVSYVDLEIDGGVADVNGDGIELSGSYELSKNVFLFGEWQNQSFDFGIDGTSIEFGAGLNHELSTDLDFVGTLSYVDTELEFGGFSADDDGLALGGGVRSRLSDSFELSAMLNWVDYDSAGSDTGFGLLGRYFFKNTMAISFGADFADNVDVLRFGFRSEF